jgi:DNA-binding IclR family transcriptional regulator
MPLLLTKGALAIAAVVAIALNARGGPIRSKTLARRLALPARHLEPMLQAMARHGILKGTRGPLGATSLRASNGASRPMRYLNCALALDGDCLELFGLDLDLLSFTDFVAFGDVG